MKLLACSRCSGSSEKTWHCGRECQRSHYAQHKQHCKIRSRNSLSGVSASSKRPRGASTDSGANLSPAPRINLNWTSPPGQEKGLFGWIAKRREHFIAVQVFACAIQRQMLRDDVSSNCYIQIEAEGITTNDTVIASASPLNHMKNLARDIMPKSAAIKARNNVKEMYSMDKAQGFMVMLDTPGYDNITTVNEHNARYSLDSDLVTQAKIMCWCSEEDMRALAKEMIEKKWAKQDIIGGIGPPCIFSLRGANYLSLV